MEFQIFEDIINNFKEPYILNKYSKKNTIIIIEFLEELKKRKQVLLEIINDENKNWGRQYSIDIFFKNLEKYKNISIENNEKFGIGNIVAIETGNPYLHIELIIKAILANCKIMFIANPTMINFNLYVTSIIREILKKEKINIDFISIVNLFDYKDKIVKNQNVIDCIIVNKDYETYNFLVSKVVSKVIYLDYGNINTYIDKDEYDEIIEDIVKTTSNLDIDVYDYKIDEIDKFLLEENSNYIFNTVVIFSKDAKKCMRFYEAMKAQNIFINNFDVNEIDIGLNIDDIQFEKRIIIKK